MFDIYYLILFFELLINSDKINSKPKKMSLPK